jgi:hypothetical protein
VVGFSEATEAFAYELLAPHAGIDAWEKRKREKKNIINMGSMSADRTPVTA